jgi:hypothetical protein
MYNTQNYWVFRGCTKSKKNFMLSSFYNTGRWTKFKKPVILSKIIKRLLRRERHTSTGKQPDSHTGRHIFTWHITKLKRSLLSHQKSRHRQGWAHLITPLTLLQQLQNPCRRYFLRYKMDQILKYGITGKTVCCKLFPVVVCMTCMTDGTRQGWTSEKRECYAYFTCLLVAISLSPKKLSGVTRQASKVAYRFIRQISSKRSYIFFFQIY